MSDLQYVVQAGDSPQGIAKKYGISWQNIYDHPRNTFLKQRKGYPIHPGDKLVVPTWQVCPVLAARRTSSSHPLRGSLDFLAIVDWNIKMMLSLQGQHPSALQSKGSFDDSAESRPWRAGEEGWEKSSATQKAIKGLWKPTIVLTAPIESAFTVLYPTLPSTTVMTSGYRSDTDQARIINNFYAQYNGPATITDVEQRRQWLLKLTVKDKNGNVTTLKIGRVGGSPHRTGLAFDLSGGEP